MQVSLGNEKSFGKRAKDKALESLTSGYPYCAFNLD